jgi:hypothetical protein
MVDKTRKDYMQDGTFAELMEAAEQALAYERGAREGYRVVRVDSSKPPRRSVANAAVSTKRNSGSRRKYKKATKNG